MKAATYFLYGLVSVSGASNTTICGNCTNFNEHRVFVELPTCTIIGRSSLGSEIFNGIPYAQPPIGPLRLKPPQALSTMAGIVDATGQAAACPQLSASTESRQILADMDKRLLELPFLRPVEESEDCLSVSVQRPAGTTPNAKLPVLF